jgi:hypothetical protein
MRVISFHRTRLFKRGIWLSAAALLAFAVIPGVLDGSVRRNPAPSLFSVGILGVLFAYFLWQTQIHRLADEVVDGDDHLKVHRGSLEEIIPFAGISAADVSTGGGMHRITVRLRQPAALGREFAFLPQASLWSNLPAVQRLAASLTGRANQANPGREA